MKRSELTDQTKQYILDLVDNHENVGRARIAANTLDEAVDWAKAKWPYTHTITLSCITFGWCGEWPDNTDWDS